jgi:hypothetical protein
MPDITKDFLDDLFNIPRNGSNIVEDDDDVTSNNNSSDSCVPFDSKAKNVAEDISKAAVVDTATPSKENVETPKEKPSVQTAIKKIAEKKSFDDLFDDLPKEDAPEIVIPKIESKTKTAEVKVEAKPVEVAKPVVCELPEPAKVEVKPDIEPPAKAAVLSGIISTPSTTRLTDGGHLWKLTSPSEKFSYFYEEKQSTLSNYLLRDGEIPFDRYYKELGEANVDTDVPTYDAEEVGRRITDVMKWRDRIKHIQLHTNSQYFVWKIYMDLLPGVLARIEYERGKQEGIIYEHMNDMSGYFGSLEGLHKSCEMVSKHLDATISADCHCNAFSRIREIY